MPVVVASSAVSARFFVSDTGLCAAFFVKLFFFETKNLFFACRVI